MRWELYLLIRSDAISSKLIKCLWVTQKMFLLITSCFLTFSVLWRNTGRLHFLNSLWIFLKILFSSTRWIESCCRTHWAPVHPCAGKQVLLYMTEKGRSHRLCCGVWAHLWQSKELLFCYDTSILKGADIVWIMKLSATNIVQFVGQNVWMLLFFSTHVWADQG